MLSLTCQISVLVMHMLMKNFLDFNTEARTINHSIMKTFEKTEKKLVSILNTNKYSFDINLSGVSATFIGLITLFFQSQILSKHFILQAKEGAISGLWSYQNVDLV